MQSKFACGYEIGIIVDELYPSNTNVFPQIPSLIQRAKQALKWIAWKRKHTLIHIDAGGGSGLGPCSCSGLPLTFGERTRQAGSWWTPTQAVTPKKQQEEHRERQTIITKQEGCSGWLPIAEHMLSIHH